MKQYLKFLDEASQPVIPFDKTAQQLLEEVAMTYSEGSKPLTVTNVMEMFHIASPATMHRKMNDLLAFGYITLVYEGENRRTKYLKLTPLAVKYFEKMESIMLRAAK